MVAFFVAAGLCSVFVCACECATCPTAHEATGVVVPMKGWQQPTAICLEPYFGVSMSAGSQDHLLSLQAMQLPGPDDSLLLTDLHGIEHFWLLPAAVKPYLSHGTVPRMGDEGSAAPQMFGSFIHGIVLRTLRAKILIALEASETSQTLP